MSQAVSIIKGDGIGPEIMDATIKVLEATGLNFEFRYLPAGRNVFAAGNFTGVPTRTIESFRETKIGLKSPLATEGNRSANLHLRRELDLFANIRPASSIPGVDTPFKNLDLVVVRENSEDLYVGEERYVAPGEVQSIKTTTDRAAEMISRVAFELTKLQGRDFLHCIAKRNILQLGDRLFSDACDRVAQSYSGINPNYLHIDALCEKLVTKPQQLGILVMSNLYGDIISDLTAGLVGGLGFAPSGNFGADCAMFEAVHGTADDIAGQNKANPTALMLSAELMLRSIGKIEEANRLRSAIFALYERGEVRTGDRMQEGAKLVGTKEFADEVIELMEKNAKPESVDSSKGIAALPDFKALSYANADQLPALVPVGVDVMIMSDKSPKEVHRLARKCCSGTNVTLQAIATRGGVIDLEDDHKPPTQSLYTVRVLSGINGVKISTHQLNQALSSIGEVHGNQTLHISKVTGEAGSVTQRRYTLFQGESEF